MTCNSCGSPLDPIHQFCPKCGEPVHAQGTPPMQAAGSPYNAPYTPPQYSAPPYGGGPAPLPNKKGFGCGKIILILVIILAILGAGIGAAIYYTYRYADKALRSSEPYMIAINALKQSPAVKERLGEIEETGFPIGAYSQTGSSGKAAFVMSVKGSKGSGQYQVELTRTNNVWHLDTAIVRSSDGHTIPVIDYRGEPDTTTPDTIPVPGASPPKGTTSGGMLNSKATSLPKPAYPPTARAVKASGTVLVQIVIDENGNVISARAISGHPLLRSAAEAAARGAKFLPVKVAGKPVKVSGTLSYSFSAEGND